MVGLASYFLDCRGGNPLAHRSVGHRQRLQKRQVRCSQNGLGPVDPRVAGGWPPGIWGVAGPRGIKRGTGPTSGKHSKADISELHLQGFST